MALKRTKRAIKKEMKRQALIEYNDVQRNDFEEDEVKTLIFKEINEYKEYIFYDKVYDRYIALEPWFEDNKIWNTYDGNNYIW